MENPTHADIINRIADAIVELGNIVSVHPDPKARIYAGSLRVDAEISKRMFNCPKVRLVGD